MYTVYIVITSYEITLFSDIAFSMKSLSQFDNGVSRILLVDFL